MALDYKSLPAKWKSAKPITMGKTGVGDALKIVAAFDMNKVTTVVEAKSWQAQFEKSLKVLDAARDVNPIKGNAKTKKWVDDTVNEMLATGGILGRMSSGVLVYDDTKKKWVLSSQMKKELGIDDTIKIVKAAWPKLSEETKQQIIKLAQSGR